MRNAATNSVIHSRDVQWLMLFKHMIENPILGLISLICKKPLVI